jgi:hypothetical protein
MINTCRLRLWIKKEPQKPQVVKQKSASLGVEPPQPDPKPPIMMTRPSSRVNLLVSELSLLGNYANLTTSGDSGQSK